MNHGVNFAFSYLQQRLQKLRLIFIQLGGHLFSPALYTGCNDTVLKCKNDKLLLQGDPSGWLKPSIDLDLKCTPILPGQ